MTDDHGFPDREHAAERYLLGEMSDADREQYEAHVFSCADCADDVRTTAAFLDDLRTQVAPPERLRPGVSIEQARPARAAVVTLDRPAPPRRLRSLFWPLPAGAAVAATLLVAVIGYQAFSVAGLQRALSAEQRLQSVPSSFLAASRSEGATITASSRQRKIGLTFSPSFHRSFPFYRCEIRDASGRLVASEVLDAPASGDELRILIPLDRLTPGPYTVDIAGLESAASTTSPLEPAHYQFTLRRQP
jgi:hypothetical protein